jgi:hypothetical protein
VIKSYLILLFVACFLFSFEGHAKSASTKKETVKLAKSKSNNSGAKSKKAVRPARKVVRLDFDEPVPPKVKTKKPTKPLAKAEAPKKTFKSISCHNGFIVGEKAYCSTTAVKPKKGRTVASVPKPVKKLK